MAERSVSIRLGTTGKADVTRSFDDIAASGDASARRLAASYERAGEEVEAAMRRQANAAAKIAAITPQTSVQMRINDANGTGFGQYEGTARQSAAAFRELFAEQERLESRTRALVAAIDPAFAAQQRFNREIGEARSLVSAGAISLDQYCAKLKVEQAELDRVTGAQGRAASASGAHRAAMQGLSFQAQDAFTQLSMGANPLSVLAIQGGQAAGQMVHLEGKLGAVAGFLTGPWGLAITGGLLLLGALTDHFLKSGDAADQKKVAVKSLTESINDLNEATKRQTRSEQDAQAETLRTAAALRQQALDARAATIEKLRSARASLAEQDARMDDTASDGGISVSGAVGATIERRIKTLDAQLKAQEQSLAKAQVTFRQAEIPAMQRRVAEAFDKTAAATGRYERAVDDLNKRYDSGRLSPAAYDAELRKLTVTRNRDTEAARQSKSASTALADADAKGIAATTDLQRAQANLAKVRATARAELKAGSITQAEYSARVGEAERAVNGARDAAREHGKATRDAAAAQRELQNDLEAVTRRFDPARAAANDYAASLDKISKLVAAGKLTKAQGDDYTFRGIIDENDRREKAQGEKFRTMFGITGDPLGDMVRDGDRGRREDWNNEQQRRQQIQENGVRTVADLYKDLMTGGVSSIWSRFQQMGLNVITELLAKWTVSKVSSSLPQLANLLSGGKAPAKNASGTEHFSGGATWIAENGPELVSLPMGSKITPAAETRRLLAGNDNAERSAPVFSFDLRGAVVTQDLLAQMNSLASSSAARGAAGGASIAEAERRAAGKRRLGRF
ncbi:hypothetical protein GGQ80_002090 [Sphingomonas jinjuensis]|uniref:Bacteriophage tail tape measure N-terminal domain-containing protein n=1 Tax=Sphingomonas jinjuensis TaxID=535907 RepID=A0A840F882_9SPHN|nr:hypothetical protein [Sphingomonas jinjuensis]MBB4154180.1 hypothetical protein [Sphingomonas jinjuensis]